MRIAIISDIHSNLPALNAVKEEIDRITVDLVVCAGDIVGYGGSPNECCAAVAERAQHVIVGNHDFAALRGNGTGMNPYAARAALWTADSLNEESKAFIGGLTEDSRFRIQGIECVMRHGSLRSIWEYLYAEDVSGEMLGEAHAQVLVFGHTHVPYVKVYSEGLIVNPGSVGQPRDGDPRASFAILETNPLHCELRRIEYDIESAAKSILKAGLPNMLADRLFSGY